MEGGDKNEETKNPKRPKPTVIVPQSQFLSQGLHMYVSQALCKTQSLKIKNQKHEKKTESSIEAPLTILASAPAPPNRNKNERREKRRKKKKTSIDRSRMNHENTIRVRIIPFFFK